MPGRDFVRTAALMALLAGIGPAFARGAEGGPNAELVALFDSICDRGAEPGPEFRSVTLDEVPKDLPTPYIGPSTGLYWHRPGPIPAFVVLTKGPGHWGGGTEEDCVVAVHGVQFEAMVARLAKRMNDRSAFRKGKPHTWDPGGTKNITLTDNRNDTAVVVTKRPGGWVSLHTPIIPGSATRR